jgi:hypothetical protein
MNYLTKEKTKVLAERNGWTLPRAEGFVDGQAYRRRGMPPSRHSQVGIDEYSLGFRAGYYERKAAEPAQPKSPAVQLGRLLTDSTKSAQESK